MSDVQSSLNLRCDSLHDEILIRKKVLELSYLRLEIRVFKKLMSVLKLIIISVRRNRACATVDICMDHSFRERERKRARERESEINLVQFSCFYL